MLRHLAKNAATALALLCTLQASAQTTRFAPTITVLSAESKPPAAASRPLQRFLPTITAVPAMVETYAPGHLVVIYRDGTVPANAAAIASLAGSSSHRSLPLFGMSLLQVADEAAAIASLVSRPEVAAVLHDRVVRAHALTVRALAQTGPSIDVRRPDTSGTPLAGAPLLPGPNAPVEAAPAPSAPAPAPAPSAPAPVTTTPPPAPASNKDPIYAAATGWAVQSAGGFGANVQGSSNATGPWNSSMGAGVRIAILDTGIDANHPDLAASLALNLSEVDQTAVPSPCDTGAPQDQHGHGTWTASLAAAAIGGGDAIGVAPQASLLNIKVLQRTPSSTGSDLTAQCTSGDGSGLLSWVLQGINDAVANHADIISLSLGTLVDLTTGDGAGWKAQFDRVATAAQQAGTVLVAAMGNDGLDLSSGHYAELPAMARGVLPVVASSNPACAENLTPGATCAAGPIARTSYSNHASSITAIAAPGGNLPAGPDNGIGGQVRAACSSGLTNTLDGLPSLSNQSFGCFGLGHSAYADAIGTSASAPLVAGAAAILRATHTNWTPVQIIAALQSTATQLPSMAEPQLNLSAALAYTPSATAQR